MRIVHVIDYFQPRLGYQETFLAREHARSGHEVFVVTSDRYNPIVYSGDAAKSLMGNRIVGAGFFIEEGTKVWRLKTLFEVPHAIWIRGTENKVLELKPDIVIVHGIVNFSALRLARLKKKLGNFKLIYDDHMTFDNSRSKLRILYLLFKWTFSLLVQEAADALVAVADACKMFMNKKYGIPLDHITIIPLGADDELFRFDVLARQEIRSQLSLRESDTVCIYTGKVIPEKRLELLIEAAKLMKAHHHIKVLIVGAGPPHYIEELKWNIKSVNLENRFIWHDVVPNKELYRFYSAADVGVWPREASISQREAMSCSLPIIISENSMATELVENNNGLLFKDENPSDLAEQIEKLLDPKLRRQMGYNSRKLVEEKLNWTTIARQFLDLV